MFTANLPNDMVLVTREGGALVLFDYTIVSIAFTMSQDMARYNKLMGTQARVSLDISQPVRDDPFNSYTLELDVILCDNMEEACKVSNSINEALAPCDITEGWVDDEEPWSSSDYAAAGDTDLDNDILF